jgi:hypothetical protein
MQCHMFLSVQSIHTSWVITAYVIIQVPASEVTACVKSAITFQLNVHIFILFKLVANEKNYGSFICWQRVVVCSSAAKWGACWM